MGAAPMTMAAPMMTEVIAAPAMTMSMLKTCMICKGLEDDGDEGVKDLIEMTMKKMDEDKDGKVSFADFEVTVKNEPLMLEAFGPCLPTLKAGEFFTDISS